MNYGSNTDTEGREITDGSSFISPIVGTPEKPYVENCKLEKVELSEDETRASFTFKQSNGSTVNHSEFSGTEDWQIENTNKRVKHICSKIVTGEEYQTAVGGASNFVDFINKIITLINGKYTDLTFRIKFIYNKNGYVSIPQFPNFIENMTVLENETTIRYNPKYDIFIRPIADATENGIENVAVKEDSKVF